MVNCCAAYQAILQERQEKEGTLSSRDKEDQLDIDMARLSAAVQAVDGMLDEIDRLLKVLFIVSYWVIHNNILNIVKIIYY